jgi:Flp pilus assembly pilin Flp
MNKLTIPRRRQFELDLGSEDGQTMAEYSVVLTLIIVVFGMAGFVVLALAIAGEFDRVTGILS